MYNITELKKGVTIEINGSPFLVLESQHSKMGRGGGVMWTKLKNFESGEIIEKTFKGEEKVKEAELLDKEAQYLYKEKENYLFMDSLSFEQFSLPGTQIENKAKFIKEGQALQIEYFKGRPINVVLPIKIDLKVAKTEPGVKGNRETAGTKPASLETGALIQVPLFVKEGDIIKIDTRDGTYIERVKN